MHAQEGVPQSDRSPAAPIKAAVLNCLACRQICALGHAGFLSHIFVCTGLTRAPSLAGAISAPSLAGAFVWDCLHLCAVSVFFKMCHVHLLCHSLVTTRYALDHYSLATTHLLATTRNYY